MYISYNWLQDYIKLSPKHDYNEVANKLTYHTVEVEATKNQKDIFSKVVVGKVLEVSKHPNADKLSLVSVDIKERILKIVCGAPNVASGQMVPVALDGAILPGDFEIKTSKIRGELSEGMICAEDELGLGFEHSGIMVLNEKAKVGEDFSDYLKMDDVILEIDNKSLSNRPDLLNHYGIARELSVLLNATLKPLDKIVNGKNEIKFNEKDKFKVEVLDKEACPRYMAIKIDNIKIGPSPDWLKERLVAINQRPVNNIVDIANYVMFELGQPLHTFDAAYVDKIEVRKALNNEKVETIDKKERQLCSDDLVITNGEKIIAIAGVMGSAESQISDKSTALVLESANFSAGVVRKTAQRLSLRSEASLRYEKSLDPNLTEVALRRFVALLNEVCPDAKIIGTGVDIYSNKHVEKKIKLNYSWLTAKIGQEIPKKEALKSLRELGFICEEGDDDEIEVVVPSWRATKDIKEKEDVVEEVLRIYGYDNIKSSLPKEELSLPIDNQERLLERKIKDMLYSQFLLTEVYNYSFVGEEQLKKLNIDYFNHLKIANPLSELNSMLRQSLVPGLFSNIKNNQSKSDDLSFFEVGNVFFNLPGEYVKNVSGEKKLPYQEKRLGVILAGKNKEVFSQLKNITSNLLTWLFNLDNDVVYLNFDNHPGWADEKLVAQVSVAGKSIGWLGLGSSDVKKNLNLKMETAVLEINCNSLFSLLLEQAPFKIKEAVKYPPVTRDLSFVLPDKILYNDIKDVLISFHPLIKSVELFDTYKGNKLPSDKKSLAFHLVYQSEEKTLTSNEVDKIQKELVEKIVEKFGAQLRDF
ncbi:MAG: phenylalanine--tRNA ligase subunit beta [Patescibacteria group bacterium]|jgi:phenylalanyl-tRNA synthetase beta chain|nr:phenylalanine--tRNA ligase subunit beta [Patescibacteria group bacterium]MDD3939452.1 phenylalanine--tRNA ligase subunit beta [Patescibacteria group bacterium]MDD4443525.1 phenylalanine--tRNA ligase subunit beta [Patescibacteria group bacterium]NCU39489.1 phenylalanine--tRNA ligase subunit beta [Candidatus Falkowbacteria bacterium]